MERDRNTYDLQHNTHDLPMRLAIVSYVDRPPRVRSRGYTVVMCRSDITKSVAVDAAPIPISTAALPRARRWDNLRALRCDKMLQKETGARLFSTSALYNLAYPSTTCCRLRSTSTCGRTSTSCRSLWSGAKLAIFLSLPVSLLIVRLVVDVVVAIICTVFVLIRRC